MGISMTIVTATDDEIVHYQAHAKELDALLTRLDTARPSVYLDGYWRALDDLLTQDGSQTHLPYSALKIGDVYYQDTEDYVHAIFSRTANALAMALAETPREQVQQVVENKWRRHIANAKNDKSTLGQWVPSRAAIEQEIGELWFYLSKYRDICAQASTAGRGLLFWRWEDW